MFQKKRKKIHLVSLAQKKVEGAIKVLYGNIELALKNLKKETKEAGVIAELRERRYHTKPSAKKRKKLDDAIRWQKKLDRDRLWYDKNTVWDFKMMR